MDKIRKEDLIDVEASCKPDNLLDFISYVVIATMLMPVFAVGWVIEKMTGR